MSRRASAPVAANGTETSRISGWTSDRKVATSSMKTIAMAASMARPSSAKASSCSSETPPMVAVAPSGRSRASSFLVRSVLTAPVLSPVGLAVIVAERCPSIRVIETGPGTTFTSAMSPSLTGPSGRAFSSATVAAGFEDRMTMSRSVSSSVAEPAGVPRTAPATIRPGRRSRIRRRPPCRWR